MTNEIEINVKNFIDRFNDSIKKEQDYLNKKRLNYFSKIIGIENKNKRKQVITTRQNHI